MAVDNGAEEAKRQTSGSKGERKNGTLAVRVGRWLSVRKVANIIGSLALVFGAAYGWMEYNALHDQRRVDRSFEYVKSFGEGETYSARREVWQVFDDAYRESNIGQLKSKENVLDSLVIRKFEEWPKYLHLERLIEFFDSISKCIKMEMCDECTAYRLLRDRAEHLSWYLTAVIRYGRERYNVNYAEGLRSFQDKNKFADCRSIKQG